MEKLSLIIETEDKVLKDIEKAKEKGLSLKQQSEEKALLKIKELEDEYKNFILNEEKKLTNELNKISEKLNKDKVVLANKAKKDYQKVIDNYYKKIKHEVLL